MYDIKTAPPVDKEVEKRVGQYISIRDRLKEMDDEFEKKRAPLVELQNLLTGWMMQFLETSGADSIKTSAGTCFNSTRYSASLADPKAFMDFVIDQRNWDLLDRKANATAVRDYVAEKGSLPPGVNLSAIRTVNVRRPTK
jgi:hypothetical protein